MYHGIDWDGPLPDSNEVESVEVPAISNPFEDDDMQELQQTLCPTAPSNDYGLDLYLQCLQFVTQKLS